MDEKMELVIHIHKDASMGYYIMGILIDKLKDKDNKIKSYIEDIRGEYKKFSLKSKKILVMHKINPEEEGFINKMMSSMGVSMEVNNDNSDSAIADMVIQGISKGSIEMKKKIEAYKDQVSNEYLKLAKEFLKFQEKSIDELKKYL